MQRNPKIKIQNIYYMLSYVFDALTEDKYKKLSVESFENISDLYAAILIKGVSKQIKRGLNREYISKKEPLTSIKGKMNISESIKDMTLIQRQMVCTYDDFSPNSYMNRILKTAMLILIRERIERESKKAIRKLLLFFRDVDTIDIHDIQWNIRYDRNNQTYKMLMGICRLVVEGKLLSEKEGSRVLKAFENDKRMHNLYEKFLLKYYQKHFPELKANASYIPWALDDENNNMLPAMQSDITLSSGDRTLIIDAKFYGRNMQKQYDKTTVFSGNLYQIFTYVKNKEKELGEDNVVSGMLLYAKTTDDIQPNERYRMSGNEIAVETLDLDKDFSEIRNRLNGIVERYFDK